MFGFYWFKEHNSQALFREFKGSIIACGAQPGQSSYTNAQSGGYFTRHFIRCPWACSPRFFTPSWNDILQEASDYTHGT